MRLFNEDAQFRAAVLDGKAYADRGEFIEEEEMDSRFEQMLRSLTSICWTPPTVAGLEHINSFLKEHQPQYREQTTRKIYDKIRDLKAAPCVRRSGRVEGTRELFFPPMPRVAAYRIYAQSIGIWRIVHTAQNRP